MITFAKESGGEALKYIEAYPLNLNNTTKTYMRNWVNNVQYFIKNQKNFAEVDIRRFLVARVKRKEN